MENKEFGDPGYAVMDVEALILGPVVRVVEQLAFILLSAEDGSEMLAEKFFVYQPMSVSDLATWYCQPYNVVQNSVDAYNTITGDNYIHDDLAIHPAWCAVKNRVRKILRRRAIKVYAKGAALERTVFGNSIVIDDLEWTSCPKYPEKIHDPLEECRFFGRYIPELKRLQ